MVIAARRLAALGLALSLLCGPIAARAGTQPPEAFGEVTFEVPEGGAYAQEMVVMVVRFFMKSRATTEALEQPNLDALGWTQLGRDNWAPTTIGSAKWFGFTRRLAVFAPEAKTYTIPPFTHHLTLIDPEDVRWKVDAVSKPAQLTIRKWTGRTDGPNDEDTWWLPAQSLTVADSWSVDPATLGAGDVARRRLELTAAGTLAEQLPPAIDTQSPGLVVFPGPVERRTEIVDGLPVAHAVYTYDIRPHTGDPVILREVLVPWFDVKARAMRQAIVPGASVGRGMVVPGQPGADAVPGAWSGGAGIVASAGVGLAAFALGLALLLAPGRRDREPVPARILRWAKGARRIVPLYRADWSGRPELLRAAVYRLARADGEAGRRWLADPAVEAALAEVDAALFGGKAGGGGNGDGWAAAGGRLTDAVLAARRRVLSRRGSEAPAASAGAFGR